MGDFGYRLKAFRQRLGREWTQQRLGYEVGVSRNTVSNWETGNYLPSRDMVLHLAEKLLLSPQETDQLLFAAQYPLEYQSKEPKEASLTQIAEARVGRMVVDHFEAKKEIMPPYHEVSAQQKEERYARLRTIIRTDPDGLLHTRLESFVGRQAELAEVRRLINVMLPTGGYILITGRAGQGKSSIIAKLIEEDSENRAAHHFIPSNPGSDYQVNLLRDLMAQLILKHALSDLYIASESRPVLRDFFPRVLEEVEAKGKHEVIFIDGLDQLKEDADGDRDLSFLPTNPPAGIVFVLGTRPNETLRPLKLLKPHHTYNLPHLSRQDFTLVLEHRGGKLDPPEADRVYQALQRNALYLDLAAKELAGDEAASPEEIIESIGDNPESIFTLALARLKRHVHAIEWRDVLKPMLGLLLVAREPLPQRHIRQILGIDDDQLRDGLALLGGLVADDGQQSYSLFHVKLYDYLHQNEKNLHKEYVFAIDEEEAWHKIVAEWCERENVTSIWQNIPSDPIEQERRMYARRHYIAHLYYAREWRRLFEALDGGVFGQGKVRNDPSMRSYAHDLDFGRQAAAWQGWTFQEGIDSLPLLWRYTLLRASLMSRADRYPTTAFQLLLLLGREREALNLVELLTMSASKVSSFLHIVKCLAEQPGHNSEDIQLLLLRAWEIARSCDESDQKVQALSELSVAFAQAGQRSQVETVWAEASRVAYSIEKPGLKSMALSWLGTAFARAGRMERAEAVWAEANELVPTEAEPIAKTMLDMLGRVKPLGELGVALARAGHWDRALELGLSIHEGYQHDRVRREVEIAMIHAGQWEHIDAFYMEEPGIEVEVLCELGIALAQAGLREKAEGTWDRIEEVISRLKIEELVAKDWMLCNLATAFIRTGQWMRARRVIHSIWGGEALVEALCELGISFAQAGYRKRAEVVWKVIESVMRITWKSGTDEAFIELSQAFAQMKQWQHAEELIRTVKDPIKKAKTLCNLGRSLAQAGLAERANAVWIEAEAAARSIEDNHEKTQMLCNLEQALSQAQQWEYAKSVWLQAANTAISIKEMDVIPRVEASLETRLFVGSHTKVRILCGLMNDLPKNHNWEQAEALIHSLENDQEKAEVLCKFGEALARDSQWERAQSVLVEVEAIIHHTDENRMRANLPSTKKMNKEKGKNLTPEQMAVEFKSFSSLVSWQIERDSLLRQLGIALALAKQGDHGEYLIWATKPDSFDREIILRQLALAYTQTQQWEQAGTVAHTLRKGPERVEVLSKLGTALAQAHQLKHAEIFWDNAEKEASQGDAWERDRALEELAKALMRAKQWERVETVAHMMKPNYGKSRILGELAIALAHTELWEQAEAVANSIEHADRDEVLCNLGRFFVQVGQRERAETAIRSIADDKLKIKALHELGLISAQTWQREQAKRILNDAGMIKDANWKSFGDKELRELGMDLIEMRQWEQAETVARAIKSSDTRAEVLRELIMALTTVGEPEQALRLVQLWWLRTTTREEAIQLLSLANAFLPFKPEIARTFCEAFTWVDSFLKG